MLHAFGIEFRIVPPISTGRDKNQLPISWAISFKFNWPLPCINPRSIAKFNSVSSVGCPGYNLCLPPPHISNACFTFFGVISASNYSIAPTTSPITAPHKQPLIRSIYISSLTEYIGDFLAVISLWILSIDRIYDHSYDISWDIPLQPWLLGQATVSISQRACHGSFKNSAITSPTMIPLLEGTLNLSFKNEGESLNPCWAHDGAQTPTSLLFPFNLYNPIITSWRYSSITPIVL